MTEQEVLAFAPVHYSKWQPEVHLSNISNPVPTSQETQHLQYEDKFVDVVWRLSLCLPWESNLQIDCLGIMQGFNF